MADKKEKEIEEKKKSIYTIVYEISEEIGKVIRAGSVKDENGKVIYQHTTYPQLRELLDPLLKEHGLAIFHNTDGDEMVTKIVPIVRDIDGGSCEYDWPYPNCSSTVTAGSNNWKDFREYGKSLTMTKRYHLLCLFRIIEEDDEGNLTSNKKAEKSAKEYFDNF